MPSYRRRYGEGGTFAFTVCLADRRATTLTDEIDVLRAAYRATCAARPFRTDAICQPRFYEHTIRDAGDHANHVHYIHANSVKHGHAAHMDDWPYSTWHRWKAEFCGARTPPPEDMHLYGGPCSPPGLRFPRRQPGEHHGPRICVRGAARRRRGRALACLRAATLRCQPAPPPAVCR